jgi:uncharacterized protein (DUF1330 family)
MAKGYWVTFYRSVQDPDAVAAYVKTGGAAIVAGGGRFLARGIPAQTYEAGLTERTVVVEFPSVDAAIACHDSEGYQAALKLLGKNAAERDFRIIAGVE